MNEIEKYERCIELARKSPCQKLGFGALLIDPVWPEVIVAEEYNKPIAPLANMCIPDCCRFNIPSRTQSMIGACGHAEEACLWTAAKDPNVNIDRLEMYVAGVNTRGLPLVNGIAYPLVKTDLAFTCIRCAVQMYLAGIRGVNVWVNDTWYFVPASEALKQAEKYATRALEVDSK